MHVYIQYTVITQPQCLPPLFFNRDLRNNKQTIKKPRAANPPTARATVLSVCWPGPDPIKEEALNTDLT